MGFGVWIWASAFGYTLFIRTSKIDLKLAVLKYSYIFSLKCSLIVLTFTIIGEPFLLSVVLIVAKFDSLDHLT